jgi:hypothetical protein
MIDDKSEVHSKLFSLTGLFGEVIIDTERPCLRSLKLRQGDGTLGVKSLLSAWPSETLPYTTGSYSYFEDAAGVRYESTASRSHVLEKACPEEIVIRGIELLPDKLPLDAPAVEDWRCFVDGNGDFCWEITRRWKRKSEIRKSATPGLFFNLRANAVATGSGQLRLNPEQNGVAVLLWIMPDMLEIPSYPHGQAELISPFFLSCNYFNHVIYNRRDGWALVKMYTSFPNDRDLFLQASNGYLFRRGKYNSHNEIGLLPDVKYKRYHGVSEVSQNNVRKVVYEEGDSTSSSLTIGSRDAALAGRQLVVEIPDKEMEMSLKRFYNGLVNAGMWTSQSDYGTGNQVDGWLIGTFWMPAVAMLAGTETEKPSSADSYKPVEAFRKEIERMLKLVNKNGEIEYGFMHQRTREGYKCPEGNMHFMIRLEMYYLATGDASLVAEYIDKLQFIMKALESYLENNLLVFDRSKQKVLIYFDAWHPDGTITYLNNMYVRAQQSYAVLLDAIGMHNESVRALAMSKKCIKAINEQLWDDNAFGLGRGGYVDFVDKRGEKHCFFCSATEYPAIVFGVANQQQGKSILKTADERIAELVRQYGYKRDATLDTLWPVKDTSSQYPFTTYQNGSVLNCWTYFEVLARCRCGDLKGAVELLRRFAEHANRTNWFEGDSAFNIRSEPHGWGHEPYLSDQVAVAAALVHGLLGIRQTPEGVVVSGKMPEGWDTARAVIPCMGKDYEVIRTRKNISIRVLKSANKGRMLKNNHQGN